MIDGKSIKIGIVGLGYVGLPLAVEFGKAFDTVGLDANKARVDELLRGYDSTLEVDTEEIKQSEILSFSSDFSAI